MRKYKPALIGILFLFTMVLAFHVSPANAQTGPQMMGQEQSGPEDDEDWFCPWCGGPGDCPMVGHGMTHHRGYGMERGMMHRRYGRTIKPITKDKAQSLVERYLHRTGNPNLKLGKLKEEDKYFEAEIVTKDNSLVDKLQIEKDTGWLRYVR